MNDMEIQEISKQKILVAEEGDFSFSLSLAKIFGSATNITATSLDIREGLGPNYCNGKSNVEELEKLGCNVVRGVNVHSMNLDYRLARYDLIVFHLPRAGKHKDVVRGFMENAKELLKDEDGQIHVTGNSIYPFNKTDLKTLAEEKGLRLIKKMKIMELAFPTYSNKTASGINCLNYSFPIELVVSLMFKKHLL